MPYGGDFWLYSRVRDISTRHGLLASYPQFARDEVRLRARLSWWTAQADIVVAGLLTDGLARWDVSLPQMFSVDTRAWSPPDVYSSADGRNGIVRMLHTPNHRGFKGTEFFVAAVDRLRAEGLKVELVLLENVPNDEIRTIMRSMDIMAEQLLVNGYALSAIEAMACGLPVLSNLSSEDHGRVFRRFAFLDECPILSTTPETVVDNLRLLITRPDLRETLGRAGREYAERYHSYDSARFLFGSIYSKLLDGAEVDLMNLYHPLKRGPDHRRVRHPLVENRWGGDPLAPLQREGGGRS
jgi:hypothetical protein